MRTRSWIILSGLCFTSVLWLSVRPSSETTSRSDFEPAFPRSYAPMASGMEDEATDPTLARTDHGSAEPVHRNPSPDAYPALLTLPPPAPLNAIEGDWSNGDGSVTRFEGSYVYLLVNGRVLRQARYIPAHDSFEVVYGDGVRRHFDFQITGDVLRMSDGWSTDILHRVSPHPAAPSSCAPEQRVSTGDPYADRMIADTDWSSALRDNMRRYREGCENAAEWLSAWDAAAPAVIGMLEVQSAHESQSHARRAAQLGQIDRNAYHNARENENYYAIQGDVPNWQKWKAIRESLEIPPRN